MSGYLPSWCPGDPVIQRGLRRNPLLKRVKVIRHQSGRPRYSEGIETAVGSGVHIGRGLGPGDPVIQRGLRHKTFFR